MTHRYVQLLHATRRRLTYQATHDHLTALPGRALFLERAGQALDAAGSAGDVGVIYVDCDRFKDVNDSFGHSAGDAVLGEVARRLTGTVRPADTVARLGGDEFGVLLVDITREAAQQIEDRVRAVLAHPYDVPGRPTAVAMTCSVGLALDEGQIDRLPGLLRRADTAMYAHKHADRLRPQRSARS